MLAAALAAAPVLASAAGLTVEDAIRAAWQKNPGLAASAGQVAAARADAEAASDARWPTLNVTARFVATDEPMQVFGIKLDQQRITQADFDPAKLNYPDPVGGVGLGAALMQPIYMGGRLDAGRRAAAGQADAEASSHERRRQELAVAVVQAYFGAQVAAEGVRHADDVLAQARETERFVKERNEKGLMLDADLARATAFRAQAQAERAAAGQRLASARAALTLLTGEEAGQADLATPVAAPAGTGTAAAAAPALPAAASATAAASITATTEEAARPDVRAAQLRSTAAQEAVGAARANLLPEVFAQGGVETLRSSIDQGATWWSVALVARWKFGFADLGSTRAAEARAAAAESQRRWVELQARNDVEEARRAVETADARLASAREAVAASESARKLRLARHRQGLLPLTEVLDAEAGLAGARALLLRSELEARVARAQLQLALGQPVEGVNA